MTSISERVVLAYGWTRALIAFGAGALGALAMPPFGVWPVLALSFSVAIWLIDGSTASTGRFGVRSLRVAAVAGWWFGFGYFVAGLWWLGAAFLVEADRFAWLLPLGVLGLPAGLALFTALGFAIARALWVNSSWRWLSFTVGLVISEVLRATVLTGFPWNSYGMAFGTARLLDQSASLVGLLGLTILAVAVLSAPGIVVTARSFTGRVVPGALAVAALLGMAAYGANRIPAGPAPLVAGVKLRVMQPNVAQDDRFREDARDAILKLYFSLSDRSTSPGVTGIADVTHLIWPESAFPFLVDRDRRALAEIAALLPPGVTLLTGAARAEPALPGEIGPRYFNSVHVIDDEGVIRDSYDKVHLVPFGEYLPLKAWADRLNLRQFVDVPGGFEPGAKRKLLTARGLPAIAPLICYEAIFPGVVGSSPRPGLLLNLTNDAWFGMTPGPHQHFAQARLRAIEEGLPLVRAANNGISAIIDPYGRSLAQLPLGVEGVIDAGLPRALPPTVYARVNELSGLVFIAFSFVCILIVRRRDA